ncbi:MAG: helix-turn-helix transcriptional regulator [Oscillospiraceae bacterium]|nr:helix-turn-helix transcriptional regulator [Oscillospiraceae bacterium]MBQ9959349.1 helix-turn-helix transcriptional regulator [Oscillospiraceae bacterium]
MATIGNRIRRARLQAGLSQQQLADQLELSRQAVGRWETDTVRPSTDNLLRLCRILNIPLQQLTADPEASVARTKPKRTLRRAALVLISLFLTLCLAGALYIRTRPVAWDAGACSGGFATAVFDLYAEQLSAQFAQNDAQTLRSAQPIRGTQQAVWEEDRIFLRFDVLCTLQDGSEKIYRLNFTGKRYWAMKYRWGGPVIDGAAHPDTP